MYIHTYVDICTYITELRIQQIYSNQFNVNQILTSFLSLCVSVLYSYPLINIPLPGTIPTKIVLPFEGKYSLFGEGDRSNYSLVKNIFNVNNASYEPHVPWAQSSPYFYVQQITLRSSVLPWTDDMQLMDAFRAPLYEVFKLLEIIRNHESNEK